MDGGGRASKGKSVQGGGNKGGVTTLSDLNRQVESDSDSDGPQEYYTGGEKSGMMVQDPTSRGRRDVDSIFDRARESGAREGFLGPPEEPARSGFAGIGRTLGGEERLPEPPNDADRAPTPVFYTITFWRNGFTVNDGPLRTFDDPANGAFLASINKTECPRELEPPTRDTPVQVNLVRREENWQTPKEPKKAVAFQGAGRTLGSTTPAPAANSAPIPTRDLGNQPFKGLVVDEKKPTTSLQLRLSDGTRLVARFNHHHTVADVRGFINASRPGAAGSYQLQTMGFPPKQLTDPLQTIEQAGLINAVVIQKAG